MTPAPTARLGSTYRLQLNGLGFAGATALVPFLHDLGIETCYVSPVTQARSGSTHGYDVVDPTRLDPALGTPEEFEALLVALADHDMGLLIDIVPNHMAASTENPFFADVLRRGLESPYAAWFDIAWAEQGDRILLPVLGGPLTDVLARGELRVVIDEAAGAALAYFDQRFPLSPETVADATHLPIDQVVDAQHYRLADWRVANLEINYRRFFDINELIGVRQEDPEVFAATHALWLGLLADPRVRGVRVDHIDGLRDPDGYFAQLRGATAAVEPVPIVVIEKILEGSEKLPRWPVEGTTGYEFGAAVVGLFVDPSGAAELARATAAATDDPRSFAERSVQDKRRAIETLLPHQRDQIVQALAPAMGLEAPDNWTAHVALATALTELTAQLGVYRTYRRADLVARAVDIDHVKAAAANAGEVLDHEALGALDNLTEVLIGALPAGSPQWAATAAWQQFTGPATAKGVEDTATYTSGQLLAAVDVGTEPDRPSFATADFHRAMFRRAADHPMSLSATSTHDSKRSHDVRCRLAVLSEIAPQWSATVAALEATVGTTSVVDAVDRLFLYENLVGVWPVDHQVDDHFLGRIHDYLTKCAREAKRHSTWTEPDEGYEAAWHELANALVVAGSEARTRIEDTVTAIECAGASNALASVVLKVAAPGVPDFYQGDDAWFFALVDPDNRVPLDAPRHRALLTASAEGLLDGWRDGRVKQTVVRRALEARRAAAGLFRTAGYEPLEVLGAAADHVVVFARSSGSRVMVAVVPRLVQSLAGPGRFAIGEEVWGDTGIVVPASIAGPLTDVLTGLPVDAPGGRLAVGEALGTLPVALLTT